MADKKIKLRYGVGVNDADYVTEIRETVGYINGKRKTRVVWCCPFYRAWAHMLERCYSEKQYPTYKGCSVIDQWLIFSTFKAWMEQQDWEGKELDKDLLIRGNKEYGPDSCVFVSAKVNTFVNENLAIRGNFPIGVSFNKDAFQVRCWSVTTGKLEYLGRYKTPEEAHQTWLKFKLEQAYVLAAGQTDDRVANALIDRYENFVNTQKAA